MNLSGKLIIGGKAWGEFENAKRTKGNIEISGYRSYGGTHSVRMVDQPQLNDNQQELLLKLKRNYNIHEGSAEWAIYELLTDPCYKNGAITNNDLFVVLDSFKNWTLEQEEE